ncbi:unnamed protein product [Absidia cylindrospora]
MPSKTKLELLMQSWLSIQKYYNTSAGDTDDVTLIPTCLHSIIKLLQAESLEHEAMNDKGPCLEYLLRECDLSKLVVFAIADMPSGMHIHSLQFFKMLVVNVNPRLLLERAFREPLQRLMSTTHKLVIGYYELLEQNPDVCSEKRHTYISKLALELVKLFHGLFSEFQGDHTTCMDLFFRPGWCKGLGKNVWKSGDDNDEKVVRQRRASLDKKIQWSVSLIPRFDMFSYLIDFMNMPGETGEIARDAILIALQLLEGDPEYTCYIVEYSGLCQVMVGMTHTHKKEDMFSNERFDQVERLALLFALLPKNEGTFTIKSSKHVVPVHGPLGNIQFSMPAFIKEKINNINAPNNLRRKPRKSSPFDTYFYRTLLKTINNTLPIHPNVDVDPTITDTFYTMLEYMNDVAGVAEKHLMTALLTQLTTGFWHPIVCTALSSPYDNSATAATTYTTGMIQRMTDRTLLHAFLVVLLGEEGGVGKDLRPEPEAFIQFYAWKCGFTSSVNNHLLRVLLIDRMRYAVGKRGLLLATLRLFDAVLDTYNQFAIYNLVLRNYISDDSKRVHSNDDDDSTLDLNPKEPKIRKVMLLIGGMVSLLRGESYHGYLYEAKKQLQYSMQVREFWQSPYPRQDNKGRSKRPAGRASLPFADSSTTTNIIFGNSTEDISQRCSDYEGIFLHRLFDLFANMLISPMELNLLVTNLLQKIACIADKRAEGVIFDWHHLHGTLYDGAFTPQTTTSGTRRTLYALLEQVTFEARKETPLQEYTGFMMSNLPAYFADASPVLDEFCKEITAVILTRYVMAYPCDALMPDQQKHLPLSKTNDGLHYSVQPEKYSDYD